MYAIGIDPGPVPGVVRLVLTPGGLPAQLVTADAVQASAGALIAVLQALTSDSGDIVIAVERFVVGPRAARSNSPAAGARTRDMVGQVAAWATGQGYPLWLRSAAHVKPWATDVRLDAAGLLALTAGLRHARDAARHALYAAVRDCGLPDPLRRAAGTR